MSVPIGATIDAEHRKPVVILDGAESLGGRALLAVSSLYWSLEWLTRVDVRFIDVVNPDVAAALGVFARDTGIPVGWKAGASDNVFATGCVYAGIAFKSAAHMRLDAARSHGVPVMLAIQYPEPQWLSSSVVLHREAAFDPRRFADHLGKVVEAVS